MQLRTLALEVEDTAAFVLLVLKLIDSLGWPDPEWTVAQLGTAGDCFKHGCKCNDNLRALLGNGAPQVRAKQLRGALWGLDATHKLLLDSVIDLLRDCLTDEALFGAAVLDGLSDTEKDLCAR